jgi:hypothetical protein
VSRITIERGNHHQEKKNVRFCLAGEHNEVNAG